VSCAIVVFHLQYDVLFVRCCSVPYLQYDVLYILGRSQQAREPPPTDVHSAVDNRHLQIRSELIATSHLVPHNTGKIIFATMETYKLSIYISIVSIYMIDISIIYIYIYNEYI
jgi:hypothetical protein